mmetsp:Transcript_80123/g.159892  ORF Transcript_80123/g.159892 Transcript_80123/m.159892 type:complete len:249 (+) Transcript_80123:2232-2978(+)
MRACSSSSVKMRSLRSSPASNSSVARSSPDTPLLEDDDGSFPAARAAFASSMAPCARRSLRVPSSCASCVFTISTSEKYDTLTRCANTAKSVRSWAEGSSSRRASFMAFSAASAAPRTASTSASRAALERTASASALVACAAFICSAADPFPRPLRSVARSAKASRAASACCFWISAKLAKALRSCSLCTRHAPRSSCSRPSPVAMRRRPSSKSRSRPSLRCKRSCSLATAAGRFRRAVPPPPPSSIS